MKICFHASAGEPGDSLRRTIQSALSSPIIDLSQLPPNAWKETISTADLVLVDLTAANASACYLTGIADALGKHAILISPIQESIPAVFENRLVIVHRWNLQFLKTELEKFASPDEPGNQPNADTPEGKFQQWFGDLLKIHGYLHRSPVEFDGATFTLREQDMDLPLVQDIARRAKSLNLRVRLL